MNKVEQHIDYYLNYFSKENNLLRAIKSAKLKEISSICTNWEELIRSKDFLKWLKLVLKKSKKYNTKSIISIFRKLWKRKELSEKEANILISFIQDNEISKLSQDILTMLSNKSSLKLKIKDKEALDKFHKFLDKIFSVNWYEEIQREIWEISWIEEIKTHTKILVNDIIPEEGTDNLEEKTVNNKKEEEISTQEWDINDENLISEQLNDLIIESNEDNNESNKPVIVSDVDNNKSNEPTLISDVEIWEFNIDSTREVLDQWFREVFLTLRKRIYYNLWFKVDSFSWYIENTFESTEKINTNTNGVNESISKQVLVIPAYWKIKKWEITEFIGWKYNWEQLFSFNALKEEAKNIWSRIPTIEEIMWLIKEIWVESFIRIAPWFRSWTENRFKLYDRYVHYWTSNIDENWKNIYISINTINKSITIEETSDINIWLSPCLIKD